MDGVSESIYNKHCPRVKHLDALWSRLFYYLLQALQHLQRRTAEDFAAKRQG